MSAPAFEERGAGGSASALARILTFLLVVAVHLSVVFLWLPRQAAGPHASTLKSGEGASTLTLYRNFPTTASRAAVDVPPTPELAPQDVNPSARDEHVAEHSAPAASANSAAPAAMAVAKCDLVAALKAALQADKGVETGLATIPPGSRSVANAIMLWDGGWVAIRSEDGDRGLAPLKAAVIDAFEAAPAECRNATNEGPILVPIDGVGGTTLLALGSGSWRASDVIGLPYSQNR